MVSTTETDNQFIRDAAKTLIRGRRTVHEFAAPASESVILEAIEQAIWAPNHHRTEPWRFYLIGRENADRIVDLNTSIVRAEKGERIAAIKEKRWREIPGWLVVTSQNSEDEIRQQENYAAVCCAIQNFMLYLWAHDIGVKWTTGAVTREDDFYRLLEINRDDEAVVGLFWYGYPASVPDQHRGPVSNIVIRR